MTTTTPRRRISLFVDGDLLATLDAYASLSQMNRTQLLHELLMPCKPSLDRLLDRADKYLRLSYEQRIESRRQLERLESGLCSILSQASGKL